MFKIFNKYNIGIEWVPTINCYYNSISVFQLISLPIMKDK